MKRTTLTPCDVPGCPWKGKRLASHKSLAHSITKPTTGTNGGWTQRGTQVAEMAFTTHMVPTSEIRNLSSARLAFELFRAQSEVDSITEEIHRRFPTRPDAELLRT